MISGSNSSFRLKTLSVKHLLKGGIQDIMEVQRKSKLNVKPKVDLRVALLKAIIRRKDIIVFDPDYTFENVDFEDEKAHRNKKQKLEEMNSNDQMMEI